MFVLQARKVKEKEEAEKWKNVPAWKRKLMMEKEKEKQEKDNEEYQKVNSESPINELLHVKTNKMTVRPTKTQISLGIRPV